jgi:tetratricopeptide (TPR) repeat protein
VNTPAVVRRLITLGGALAAAGAMVSAQSQAQDSIELRARDLYASAEYDQALAVIGDSQEPAAQQYRALCLLALGRQADAEAALKRLITSAPEFTLSAEDMPPRFVTLFAQQRREIVPGVLRKLFADAREDYRAKAYDRALPQFKRMLALSSEMEVRDAEGVDDLRLLAESFIDIATASEAPKAEATASAAPAAAPAAASASPTVVSTQRPTLPVAIRQEMPPWPAGIPARAGLSGSVKIRINSSGKVVSSAMMRPIDPRYDARVLAATHFWEYKPATANGVPVDADSIVEITISPTR